MGNCSLYELDSIIEKYRNKSGNLIPVLHEVQNKVGYLPLDVQEYIAKKLKVPFSKVYGVVTFYAQFSLEPKGKYVIKVCDGTACHVRGSSPLYKAIRKKLGLVDGRSTTDDLNYTVETVSCLGACGLAPVVTINDKVYGQMTPEGIEIIIDTLMGEEMAENENNQ